MILPMLMSWALILVLWIGPHELLRLCIAQYRIQYDAMVDMPNHIGPMFAAIRALIPFLPLILRDFIRWLYRHTLHPVLMFTVRVYFVSVEFISALLWLPTAVILGSLTASKDLLTGKDLLTNNDARPRSAAGSSKKTVARTIPGSLNESPPTFHAPPPPTPGPKNKSPVTQLSAAPPHPPPTAAPNLRATTAAAATAPLFRAPAKPVFTTDPTTGLTKLHDPVTGATHPLPRGMDPRSLTPERWDEVRGEPIGLTYGEQIALFIEARYEEWVRAQAEAEHWRRRGASGVEMRGCLYRESVGAGVFNWGRVLTMEDVEREVREEKYRVEMQRLCLERREKRFPPGWKEQIEWEKGGRRFL